MNGEENVKGDTWEIGAFIYKGKRYAVILQTEPIVVARTNRGGMLAQSRLSLESQGWQLMPEDQRRRLTGRR